MFGVDVRDFMAWLRDTLGRNSFYRQSDMKTAPTYTTNISDDQIDEAEREVAHLTRQVDELYELRAKAQLQRRSVQNT